METTKAHTNFDFFLVRRVLLMEPGLVDGAFRKHVRWCVNNGLLSGDEGLTAKGRDQAALVRDEAVFRRGVNRCEETFGSRSWPQLIWILKRRNKGVGDAS